LENVMYVFQNEDFVSVAILRAFTALPGHFCFGILMGYYYSLARFYHYGSRRNMLLALVAPIVAHGIYDSLLFAMSVSSSAAVSVVV
jgi:RsiW-degrading membrane proteinase PrsW (M82 family)